MSECSWNPSFLRSILFGRLLQLTANDRAPDFMCVCSLGTDGERKKVQKLLREISVLPNIPHCFLKWPRSKAGLPGSHGGMEESSCHPGLGQVLEKNRFFLQLKEKSILTQERGPAFHCHLIPREQTCGKSGHACIFGELPRASSSCY